METPAWLDAALVMVSLVGALGYLIAFCLRRGRSTAQGCGSGCAVCPGLPKAVAKK